MPGRASTNNWREAPGLRLLLVRYEDMVDDLAAVLGQIAGFLELPVSPAVVASLAVGATASPQSRRRTSSPAMAW